MGLYLNGKLVLDGYFALGSAANPTVVPLGDPDTGIWWPAADTFAISTGGVERERIMANGVHLINGVASYGRLGQLFEVNTSANYGGMALNTWSAGDQPILVDFNKSKSSTIGTQVLVANGDTIAALSFRASDGVAFSAVATLEACIDAVAGVDDLAGRLVFGTRPNGELYVVERLRIDNAGNFGSISAWGTSAAKVLGLASGTAPTTSPANAAQIWVADRGGVADKAGLHLRNESGVGIVLGDRIGIGAVAATAFTAPAGRVHVSAVGVDDIPALLVSADNSDYGYLTGACGATNSGAYDAFRMVGKPSSSNVEINAAACDAGGRNIRLVTGASKAVRVHGGTLDGDGIDLRHAVAKAASANVRNSHDAEATTQSDAYVKLKTITFTNGLVGVARFLFDLKTSDSVTPTTATARIYRNGVALGTEQTDVTGGYVTKSEDLTQTWNPGDTAELWAKIGDVTDTCYVQNFRIAYDDAPTVQVASANS